MTALSSQYFGFDDEEIPDIVDANVLTAPPAPAIANTPLKVQDDSKKMSISEIQVLLGKDSTPDESTLDSTAALNESSFYADEDTSICQSQLDSFAEESFSIDDSVLSNITIVNGKRRKIIKAERKTRKILGSLDCNSENPSTASTPVRTIKKRAPRSASKNKENQLPKRVKAVKREVPDEDYDELADQLNKRFQEIENFKLIVE